MPTDSVRIWRPENAEGVLLMAGRTTAYAVEPRDEYVFGVVNGQPMRARRGRASHLVAPGQAVAWDPTDRHTGHAIDARPWTARLMIVEAAELRRLASDEEDDHPLVEIVFPDPVIADPHLAVNFLRLHRALEQTGTRLEHDEKLSAWLSAVVRSRRTSRRSTPSVTAREDRALRIALDYLATHYDQNIGLDQLAHAAGIGKFRLVRLVRQQTGISPHALHIAHRIRAARRLLETGQPIAQAAAATGFSDQSHLHRHFTRSLGVTPGEYRRRVL